MFSKEREAEMIAELLLFSIKQTTKALNAQYLD